jgi:lysophospholipase L1-like esterase
MYLRRMAPAAFAASIAMALAVLVTLTAPLSAHADGARTPGPPHEEMYYISMGDSLAAGAQLDPDTGVPYESRQGYADQIYRVLRKDYPKLKHIRLGCGGETSTTLVSGGLCDYPRGSQLSQALNFIERNKGRVVLLTLNIGTNDLAFSGCFGVVDPSEQIACFQETFGKLAGNLGQSLNQITTAAKGRFPVVAANMYNLYLNSWLQGAPGQAFAKLSAQLELQINNQVFYPLYNAYGVRVADLAGAFSSQDFTTMVPSDLPPPNDVLPLNVANLCKYTYACPHPESGLPVDFHFNTTGYSLVAREFLSAFRK